MQPPRPPPLLSPETPLLEFHRPTPSSSASTAASTSSPTSPPSSSPTSSPPPTRPRRRRALLVLATQHGDEPCGVLAVNRLISENGASWPFHDERCAFDAVVVALGNPRAFLAKTRQVEENLNRCFPSEKSLEELVQDDSTYERRRAGELAKLLSAADAVLDIHSASAASPAFSMFPPSSSSSASLARALGGDGGIPFALKDFTGEGLGLAIEWAAAKGNKRGEGGGGTTAAVTVEAGQHSSSSSVDASVAAIEAALSWKGGEERTEATPKVLVVRRGEVVRKGFRWRTANGEQTPPAAFTRFEFDQLVASDEEKGELRCGVRGGALIVLPAAKPVEGEDAFLWGEEEEEEEKGMKAAEEVEKNL